MPQMVAGMQMSGQASASVQESDQRQEAMVGRDEMCIRDRYFPKVNFGGMNYEPIWKTLCFVSEGQHRDASRRIQPGRSKRYADTICGS